MKKLIITVAIPIIIVTTMLVNFVGAAMLELTNDDWDDVIGTKVITEGMLDFIGVHVGYEYVFAPANQTTEGSYEFDIMFDEDWNWMGFGKGIGGDRDLIQANWGGGAIYLWFKNELADARYFPGTTDDDFVIIEDIDAGPHKIAISYVFDEAAQTLTQTVYLNGDAVATDVTYEFTELEPGSKFEKLTFDGSALRIGNVKWSSDTQEFVPGTGTEPTTEPTTAPTTEPTTTPGDNISIVYFMMLILMSLAVLLFTLKNKKIANK